MKRCCVCLGHPLTSPFPSSIENLDGSFHLFARSRASMESLKAEIARLVARESSNTSMEVAATTTEDKSAPSAAAAGNDEEEEDDDAIDIFTDLRKQNVVRESSGDRTGQSSGERGWSALSSDADKGRPKRRGSR